MVGQCCQSLWLIGFWVMADEVSQCPGCLYVGLSFFSLTCLKMNWLSALFCRSLDLHAGKMVGVGGGKQIGG